MLSNSHLSLLMILFCCGDLSPLKTKIHEEETCVKTISKKFNKTDLERM
ncbi:hypothetical protein POP15_135 [Pectobacterium phage POP15]|nr:hypothetical protein POP15_135 [Pectobacterium phage POP15]